MKKKDAEKTLFFNIRNLSPIVPAKNMGNCFK